ncbi:MAG: PEP-CTERM sorting domain-containing protein [Pirellulaceae bacterium]
MRASVTLFFGLLAAFGSVAPVSAEITYHFKPGIEGQTIGLAQYAQIAPDYGPQFFKVQVAGALVGSDPSADTSTPQAYLDKWGMGVLNPVAGNDVGVQGQVLLNATCGGEYLRLKFLAPVQLTYLTFALAGISDKFQLMADGNAVNLDDLFPGMPSIRSISKAQGNWPGTVDFTQAKQPIVYARTWDVITYGAACGDGVQLENVGVNPGKDVPEPSTLILWVVGLAAAGVLGVRRRIRVTH